MTDLLVSMFRSGSARYRERKECSGVVYGLEGRGGEEMCVDGGRGVCCFVVVGTLTGSARFRWCGSDS